MALLNHFFASEFESLLVKRKEMKLNDYENNMNKIREWAMTFNHYYSLLQTHSTSSMQNGAIH